MSNFHETEIEIWGGFVSVGNTEKKIEADYEQPLRLIFFMFSWAKFFYFF